MGTRLSVAVMAHPKRRAMVKELRGMLDRSRVKVVWDEIQDRHDTGGRSMAAYNPRASHHLVIQDDALPCRDVISGAEKMLQWIPAGHPASLYLGAVQPFRRAVEKVTKQAETHGNVSFITMEGVYWGPAIIVPTEVIPDMLEWYNSREAQRVTNYDRRVSVFFEQRGVRCWYPWPSLVDHRGDESIVHDRKRRRVAHFFVGKDESALDVKWDGQVIEMPGTSAMDRARQRDAIRAKRREERARILAEMRGR